MEDAKEMCEKKLVRAEKLLGGLGGEKTRWTQSAKELSDLFDNVAGDVLVSAGLVAYLGPFTAQFRQVDYIIFMFSAIFSKWYCH